jgi:hypothetical protein
VKDIKCDILSLRWNVLPAAPLRSLAATAEGQKAARDLTEASLEDLMDIEVKTVRSAGGPDAG